MNSVIKDENREAWVIGVGGRGLNLINRMISIGLNVEKTIAVAVKDEQLRLTNNEMKYLLHQKESISLEKMFYPHQVPSNSDIIIVNGLGGMSAPYMSDLIKKLQERNNIVIATISTPFSFEAKQRLTQAIKYKEMITKCADVTVVLDNDEILNDKSSKGVAFPDALQTQDNIIIRIIWAVNNIATKKDTMPRDIYRERVRNVISIIELIMPSI